MTEPFRIARTPPELVAPGASGAPYVPLIGAATLPAGTMARVSVGDLDLLVAHVPDGLLVTEDRCPHMSAPLSLGALDGCEIDCPLHNGRFDLCTGSTVRMPTTGGLDADGVYHPTWTAPGSEPKPDPPGRKTEARRLTRVRRLRYYPARVAGGMVEAAIPVPPSASASAS